MWIHFLITLTKNDPRRAFDTYAPSIVNVFCFGGLSANARAAVGLFLQSPFLTPSATSLIPEHLLQKFMLMASQFMPW